jgi:hypothetical protein
MATGWCLSQEVKCIPMQGFRPPASATKHWALRKLKADPHHGPPGAASPAIPSPSAPVTIEEIKRSKDRAARAIETALDQFSS